MAYESKIRSDEIDELFELILNLKNKEECYRLFEDICTIKEIKAMGQRLHVAKLLTEKKTYTDIEKITGASTATISRVNRTLMYGADGYSLFLTKEKDKDEAGDAEDSSGDE